MKLSLVGPLFGEAVAVLGGNRTRSLLTILGLVIGVAAVIAIQILGKGMAGAVTGVLGSLDDRSFIVFPKQQQSDAKQAAFTVDDIDQAVLTIPNIVTAMPAGGAVRTVAIEHAVARLSISGDAEVSFAAVPLAAGRDLQASDVASAAHVTVLSHAAYAKLFTHGGDPHDALGASLRAGDRRFEVIGVEGPPTQGIVPTNFGGDVRIPYTTYEREYVRGKPLFAARFIVRDGNGIADTENAVKAYLSKTRGHAEYNTFDRRSFSSSVDGIFAALTLVVALIGAVSLVVAGIGIMNIMLVSVSERTREIGLRKAIGATRGQVLAQFFIEALLLSLVGCGIGLAIGLALGYAVDRFALVAISGVVPALPWVQSVATAVGFATLVTLVFGTYPAYRAARLDPIEALRYE